MNCRVSLTPQLTTIRDPFDGSDYEDFKDYLEYELIKKFGSLRLHNTEETHSVIGEYLQDMLYDVLGDETKVHAIISTHKEIPSTLNIELKELIHDT